MRAIDLYSGVGGWSLGLALAGIEVIASYERFEPANETNRKNNRHVAVTADIRTLDIESLPKNIDLVVGSPPCTQFSYSNRGGSGDLTDGLKDIRCFLSIVDHLRPRFWAMENVPRTAGIIAEELRPGGRLADFAHLQPAMAVVNMEEWGLPQRRKRCIVGNFDFDLLSSYKAGLARRTLGDVVSALGQEVVADPHFDLKLPFADLVDHVEEEPLNEEEVRVNRASKETHPVYNAMPFPDRLDRSARTITATCTRVSRESIVISHPRRVGEFRRLTLRERAALQGFPITFQFFGASHGQKATMIGNAVPPVFAYYIASACRGTPQNELLPLKDVISRFAPPLERPLETRVDLSGGRYRADRTFRVVVPGFSLKSGVRFELSNKKRDEVPSWGVTFYFGSSKTIQSLTLDHRVLQIARSGIPSDERGLLEKALGDLDSVVRKADIKRMQDVWTRRGPGGTRPFDLVDSLSACGAQIQQSLSTLSPSAHVLLLAGILRAEHADQATRLIGLSKLEKHAEAVVAGAIMGAAFNTALCRPKEARRHGSEKGHRPNTLIQKSA